MKEVARPAVFGKRKEPHTLIIARGNEIKHVTVRPWLTGLAAATLALGALGFIFSTAYLVLRDDLISAATARQARMQQSYEDRIASLRSQVDRITSRQLLDQQLVETKVSELLARQTQLTARHGKIGPLLDEAEAAVGEAGLPVPAPKPDQHATVETTNALSLASVAPTTNPFAIFGDRSTAGAPLSAADRADRLFVSITESLENIETQQLARIETLSDNAEKEASAISVALKTAGLRIENDFGKADVGGPLVPVDTDSMFDAKVKDLDDALNKLETLKKEARKLPLSMPSPGREISSRFGVRSDPFIGSAAMHAGVDFRAPTGAPIKATGVGTIIHAGWSGGYGNMVEIQHANGLSTRFGHMSRIDVAVGQKVRVGDVIGLVGSTGRSTGPHIHYEVRKDGKAMDPMHFLKAGMRISKLLK